MKNLLAIFVLCFAQVCFGVSYYGKFFGDGAGLTNLSGASGGSISNGAVVNLSGNLYEFPDVIRCVFNVYGVALGTNNYQNSDGYGYTASTVLTNGGNPAVVISNTIFALIGKKVIVDTSYSTPNLDEKAIISGVIGSQAPPYDNSTRVLSQWLRGSRIYTGQRTLDILGGMNAVLEANTLNAEQSYAVATNFAKICASAGDAVMIANSFMNYVYFQSYTNQNAAGINVSNFNVFVTNNVSMLPVWDVWGFLWPYATNASFSSLPWTVDGYHPSDYQWKLLATNLVNNIATNALIAAQLDAPQPPKVFHGFAKNTGFFSASTTNYQIAYYANSGVVGASGAKTNNPVTCNMTVSNLLPCTSYSWIMRFRCNGAAGGQRLDLTTDGNTPVLQWDSMYYIGSIQWANEGNYGNTSNSVIAGSARPLSNGSSDVVLQTSQGTFTTSTNFTALQLLISCKSTNTSSVFGEGSLDVWMTGEKIQSF